MTFALFDHIGACHPFGGELARLRHMVNASSGMHCLLQEVGAAPPTIHAEVKAIPDPEGGFVFDRFYWSAQAKTPGKLQGLAAITLTAAPPKSQINWLNFPADPYLSRASSVLSGTKAAIEVLRYVPLRRLTFVETNSEGLRRIGKFKRRSRYKGAFSTLGDVARASKEAGVAFSVSQPLALDDESALYFQSCLSGVPAPDLVTGESGSVLMAEIGHVHAEVHRMVPWSSLPALTNAGLLVRAERDLALIRFYVKELGDALTPVATLLRKAFPGEDIRTVCHGDFVASQLLFDGQEWSVIDFDLVTVADPYHDLSIFLASLDYDVPWIEARSGEPWKERFGAEYLAGYGERSGVAIDRRRLAWHRLAAEIYYLALMLKKDRFEIGRALRRVADMKALAEDLT